MSEFEFGIRASALMNLIRRRWLQYWSINSTERGQFKIFPFSNLNLRIFMCVLCDYYCYYYNGIARIRGVKWKISPGWWRMMVGPKQYLTYISLILCIQSSSQQRLKRIPWVIYEELFQVSLWSGIYVNRNSSSDSDVRIESKSFDKFWEIAWSGFECEAPCIHLFTWEGYAVDARYS